MKKLLVSVALLLTALSGLGQGTFVFNTRDIAAGNNVTFWNWNSPASGSDLFVEVLAGPDLRSDGKLPEGWREEREPFLLESSVPGVFVAGDVRHGSVKRVASAVGEGSIAVQFVHQYLAGF